jgi:hypothetical protein
MLPCHRDCHSPDTHGPEKSRGRVLKHYGFRLARVAGVRVACAYAASGTATA